MIAGDTVEIKVEEFPSVTVHRRVSAEGVRDLLDNADMGIFPASTVCVEAFSRHLPVAAGYFVSNQEEFYAEGVKRDGSLRSIRCLTAVPGLRQGSGRRWKGYRNEMCRNLISMREEG